MIIKWFKKNTKNTDIQTPHQKKPGPTPKPAGNQILSQGQQEVKAVVRGWRAEVRGWGWGRNVSPFKTGPALEGETVRIQVRRWVGPRGRKLYLLLCGGKRLIVTLICCGARTCNTHTQLLSTGQMCQVPHPPTGKKKQINEINIYIYIYKAFHKFNVNRPTLFSKANTTTHSIWPDATRLCSIKWSCLSSHNLTPLNTDALTPTPPFFSLYSSSSSFFLLSAQQIHQPDTYGTKLILPPPPPPLPFLPFLSLSPGLDTL